MSYHLTESGHVELLGSWGHGRSCNINLRRPCLIVTDDGDGHFEAWIHTGKRQDALLALARLEKLHNGNVVVQDATGYSVQSAPDDFWIETPGGDFVPNTAAYPDIIAY